MSIRFPELYISLYAFFLNLLWEAFQSPLFIFEQQSSPFSLGGYLLFCLGVDAIMTLTAYWVLSVAVRDRYWFLSKHLKDWVSFVGIGLILALVSVYTAIHYRNLWEYSSLMPVIPVVQLGLTPILQWLLIPPMGLILLVHPYRSRLVPATEYDRSMPEK